MQTNTPNIYKKIDNEKVFNILNNNFNNLTIHWFNFNFKWLNTGYKNFKDLEKYLILIFIVKKNLDFYSRHFIKLSCDQYYSKKKLKLKTLI